VNPKVLVPVDLSAVSGQVVDGATQLARQLGADVVLLHVEPPDPAFLGYEVGPKTVRDALAKDIQKDDDRLHTFRDRMRHHDIEAECLLIQGPFVDKVIEESERLNVDYVVIGSHGHGALYDLVVGSVCDGVVRRSRRPVVVIPRNIKD